MKSEQKEIQNDKVVLSDNSEANKTKFRKFILAGTLIYAAFILYHT